MYALSNVVQNYAWGSRSALARLRGETAASPQPEAELWMGAHPSAPSRVEKDGSPQALDAWIARDPQNVLGAKVCERFGPRLPFLLKVLAAETPLSLQAHPNRAQAEAGFDAEQARGIALGDPRRNYKDRNHKPELICALEPFDALCGFRAIDESLELFEELKIEGLDPYLALLRNDPTSSGLRALVAALLGTERDRAVGLADAARAACAEPHAGSKYHLEHEWALRIAALYPGDAGIVVALLLNLVRLEPGQALYLPAGNLHAYLEGLGIEIMASSDNVLRGGLTPKHVDVAELERVVVFESDAVTPLLPEPIASGELVYTTPAPEFRLSRIDVSPEKACFLEDRGGPEILLVALGSVEAETDDARLVLAQGASAFVPASSGRIRLAGQASVYRARVNAF